MDSTLLYLLMFTVWLGLVAMLVMDKLFGPDKPGSEEL